MNVIARRPVKIEGLNSGELEAWIKQDGDRKAAIMCQILIALCNGNSMTEVCKMFNVTRESVRRWRNIVVSKGPNGLVAHSFHGRKSQLTPALKKQLKKIMAKPPHRIGYKKPRWSGKLLVSYLEKEHNIVISIRTAQLWMKMIKNQ
jgi:transposase